MSILTSFVVSPETTTEYSLAELRALKARWLADAEAQGQIEACRQVARWLGEPFSIPRRDSWTGYRWTAGEIEITLYEGQGFYLPSRKDYDRIAALTVKCGPHQVAYCRMSDGAGVSPDSFFVPGQWLEAVLSGQAEALQAAKAAGQSGQQFERARLAAQLLIGVNV